MSIGSIPPNQKLSSNPHLASHSPPLPQTPRTQLLSRLLTSSLRPKQDKNKQNTAIRTPPSACTHKTISNRPAHIYNPLPPSPPLGANNNTSMKDPTSSHTSPAHSQPDMAAAVSPGGSPAPHIQARSAADAHTQGIDSPQYQYHSPSRNGPAVAVCSIPFWYHSDMVGKPQQVVSQWSLQGVELKRGRLLVHFRGRKGLMVWYGVGFA